MKRFLTIFLMVIAVYATAQSLQDRIRTNDPSKYRQLTGVHAGAGEMGFTGLISGRDMSTNFLYLHTGLIEPKSGIGHHFHHTIEEMYVILNGEAEFTINGHTSVIKAPAIVPCKMGDSHGIYNASDEQLKWLNFAVSTTGRGDNFDLADTREGATIDPIPVFVSGRLEKENMRPGREWTGEGVMHRRIMQPAVFSTDWNHVDHLVVPAGGKTEARQLLGIEEVYYVVGGEGTLTIDGESVDFKSDDAFFGKLGETVTLTSTGSADLELLVIGVTPSKEKGLAIQKPTLEPFAMALQMDFVVKKENAAAFEKMYYSIYVPAMTVQDGYISSKLLRLYNADLSKQIQAEPTTYNYQVQISFDTEANRMKWVNSDQHKIAWPSATSLAEEYKWRGYDVLGEDDQR